VPYKFKEGGFNPDMQRRRLIGALHFAMKAS
jgi:hypothetical protein